MKQSTPSRVGERRIPSEQDAEIIKILLTLPELIAKKELFSQYTFTWGKKKKRSVLVTKSELSPVTHHRSPEKLTAADKSPSTPLCFLPCGNGSDGYDNPKEMLALKKSLKRKATDDLIVEYNEKHQEKEMLIRKIKDMNNHLQELQSQNLDLIAKRQQINYPRNMENVQLWDNPMKINHYHHQQQKQMTMFTPLQQQSLQQHRQQQLIVDPNSGKLVAMSCNNNSNGGGSFGLFNQIETRVNIQGETYDFMALSQPLDQNNYKLMDKDLKVRNAAAARKRRIMRMKEIKYSMKQSRFCR